MSTPRQKLEREGASKRKTAATDSFLQVTFKMKRI
jgi:hypothetical protein